MRVEVSLPVSSPAERAWALLAELDRLAEWAPDVAESPSDALRPGAVRRARLKKPAFGKDVLVERIVAVGPRSLLYDIEGGIGPLRAIRTTWRIEPAGPGSCVLRVASDLKVGGVAAMLPALVRRSWRRQLEALARGFRDWAEEPSTQPAAQPA